MQYTRTQHSVTVYSICTVLGWFHVLFQSISVNVLIKSADCDFWLYGGVEEEEEGRPGTQTGHYKYFTLKS